MSIISLLQSQLLRVPGICHPPMLVPILRTCTARTGFNCFQSLLSLLILCVVLTSKSRQLAHVQFEQACSTSACLPCNQLCCAPPRLSRPFLGHLELNIALGPESAAEQQHWLVDGLSFSASKECRMQVQMLVETCLYELKSAIACW